MYYLTMFGDAIESGFRIIPKVVSANLCKSMHDIINFSFFICPFESGKCGKEGKELQKFESFWEGKELFRVDKKHFS